MREFELPAQDGRPVSLGRELAAGAVVLVFYRGDWWPYCNGQLVELARLYDEFRAAGAEVVGISVDSVAQNAAMTEKLGLPFPLLSDPDGRGAIWQFGVWDENGSIARPATVGVAPDGLELARFEGSDYADRPVAEELLEDVRALALRPRELRSGVHPHVAPQPGRDAYPRESLPVYFRAVRSSALAIYERTGSEDARRIAEMGGRYYETLTSR